MKEVVPTVHRKVKNEFWVERREGKQKRGRETEGRREGKERKKKKEGVEINSTLTVYF